MYSQFTDFSSLPIKKLNDPVEKVSQEEFKRRLKEIIKCKSDIVYFAEHYFHVVTSMVDEDGTEKGTRTELIKLYSKQKDLLRAMVDSRRLITLAARQSGKTTTYTIFCLWLTLFHPEKKILLCANQLATAIQVMDRIRLAYEDLPYFLKAPVLVYNKAEITFCNQSSIRAFSTSSSSARGFSANVLVIDEAAFIPKGIMDDFFAAVMPIISSDKNSKVILVSTPNGTSGIYYDLWMKAVDKSSGSIWTPFRIDWWDVPGRDDAWKEAMIATSGEDKFRQEFGNEFVAGSSIYKLIPDDQIEMYRKQLSEWKKQGANKPQTVEIVSENRDKVFQFKMWKAFDKNRTYLATGDVAEGTGGDYSVLYIWDITDTTRIEMCAKFADNKTNAVEFAYVCNKIFELYGEPYFACESNGVGSAFLDLFRLTYEYTNLVQESKENTYGIRSHVQLKIKACLWLNEMFTTPEIGWILYDSDLIDEMTTFVRTEGKFHVRYAAAKGAHDDLIMSLCWCAFILQPDIVERYFDVRDTVKTELNKVLPRKIAPYEPYSRAMVNAIEGNPINVKFKEKATELVPPSFSVFMKSKWDKVNEKLNAESEKEAERKRLEDTKKSDADRLKEQMNKMMARVANQQFPFKRPMPSDYTPMDDSIISDTSDLEEGEQHTPFFVSSNDGWADSDFDGPGW